MSEYYIIDKSAEYSVAGGEYPQCSGLVKGYNCDAENSIDKFAEKKGKKVNYIPNLDGIKLYMKATFTDLISCGLGPGNDAIISYNMMNTVSKFNTSELQVFECYLYKRSVQKKYCWVHFVYSLERHIDFVSSEFSHPNESLANRVKDITSYKDYLAFYDNEDKYGLIRSEKLVIKAKKLDFFVIGQFNQKLYVSETLKLELQKNGYTGFEFVEAQDVCFV